MDCVNFPRVVIMVKAPGMVTRRVISGFMLIFHSVVLIYVQVFLTVIGVIIGGVLLLIIIDFHRCPIPP